MIDPATLDMIRSDIEHNVESQKERLREARSNLQFYKSCDSGTPHGHEDSNTQRQSWLLRQVVDLKTRDLYKQSPTRIIPGDQDRTKWLEEVYKRNGMWAKFAEADRLSMVADVAWFQVAATGKLRDPIRINLYGSDQVAAWSSPEDPTKPVAVCQIAESKALGGITRKYELWTDEVIVEFMSKGDEPPAFRGTKDNPYGVIPFVSVHYEFPTTTLWTSSPGSYLVGSNKYINWRLSEIADLIESNPPMKVVEGADANFQPPRPFGKDDFLEVPGSTPQKDGKFRYEQANLGFVTAEWDDLNNYIEHTLNCVGVPPAAYRQVQTSSKSGAAMVAEQISLIEAAKGRQMPFASYEERLANVCFQVHAAYYEQKHEDTITLTVKWADLYPQMPGEERDRGDQWDLDNELQSKVTILMKREGMTRDEAELHLVQVANDKTKEATLFGVSEPNTIVSTNSNDNKGNENG